MTHLSIIFLDVDGVLNSVETFTAREASRVAGTLIKDEAMSIDRGLVMRLNRLIELTGAKVVVSSVWRMNRTVTELQALLELRGFRGEVIGTTPELAPRGKNLHRNRGDEIQWWLTHEGVGVKSFVILDDDSDMGHLRDRLVQTTFATGLQDHHVSMAVTVLRRPVRRSRRSA